MSVREQNNWIEYMVTCVGDFAAQCAGIQRQRLARCLRFFLLCILMSGQVEGRNNLSLNLREGFLGGYVLLVSNLSLTDAISFELNCTENDKKKTIIDTLPANQLKAFGIVEFGGLTSGWGFREGLAGQLRQCGESEIISFRILDKGVFQIDTGHGTKELEPLSRDFCVRTEAVREKDFWSLGPSMRLELVEMAELALAAYEREQAPRGYELIEEAQPGQMPNGLRYRCWSNNRDRFVVAFPGVEFKNECVENDLGLVLGLECFQRHPRADAATKVVRDIAKKHPGDKIYIVGHSLGGAIVQYVLSELRDVHCELVGVTFNAYGCRPSNPVSHRLIQVHLDKDPVFSMAQSWHYGELYMVASKKAGGLGECDSLEYHKLDALISAMKTGGSATRKGQARASSSMIDIITDITKRMENIR